MPPGRPHTDGSSRSQSLLRATVALLVFITVAGAVAPAAAAYPAAAQASPNADANLAGVGPVTPQIPTEPGGTRVGSPTAGVTIDDSTKQIGQAGRLPSQYHSLNADGDLYQVSSNGTNNSSAPTSGQAIPSSCEEVKNNLQGQGPNYRVVTGECSISLSDGEILSNVLFRANGQAINIQARGSGWTVRNIGILNAEQGDDTVIDLQVNSRSGRGVYQNVYIDGTSANAIFVNRHHVGHISVVNSTFLNIGEDALYGSPPGNPSRIKPGGFGGTISVQGSYIKGTGNSNEEGYGFRFGSDGSSISDSTIVGADVGVANLFAGGELPERKPGTSGVTMRNVNIGKGGLPIRLNSHQDQYQRQRTYSAITSFQSVCVEGGSGAVQRNEIEGVGGPIVRGSVCSTPNLAPPPGAPRSAIRAASGVGGGTGSIGGPITGDGGSGGGAPTLPLTIIGTVLVVMVAAVVIIGLLFVLPFLVLWKLR